MANFTPTKTDCLRVLLERLFPDTRISDTGVALLAAEIADLEHRCEAMQGRIDFDARQMVEVNVLLSRKINREPTITQNSALYLAHCKILARRAAFFRRLRAKARIQPADVERRTSTGAHFSRRFHPDNGR
jgi:hypothetical protein